METGTKVVSIMIRRRAKAKCIIKVVTYTLETGRRIRKKGKEKYIIMKVESTLGIGSMTTNRDRANKYRMGKHTLEDGIMDIKRAKESSILMMGSYTFRHITKENSSIRRRLMIRIYNR